MTDKNQIKCKFGYDIENGEVTITRYNNDLVEIINGKTTITRYNDSPESIVIPETIDGYPVTKIDVYCFWFNKNLISLYIPKSIKHIPHIALQGTHSLKYINNDMILNQNYLINNRFIFRDGLCYTITYQICSDYYCGFYYIIDDKILRKL